MSSDKIIEEAISNIRDDRETTRELLDDAMRYLAQDMSRHRDIGQTLAQWFNLPALEYGDSFKDELLANKKGNQ